jgi:5'-methylthioinosine phosphorylase
MTTMTELAIIGGTGALDLFEVTGERAMSSAWGTPSAPLAKVTLGDQEAWFLARHGRPHRIPPHRIDYRANIDGLRGAGVKRVVSINAVGGIDPELPAGCLVVPDQLIDYTWGRAHSFSDDADSPLMHVEFAEPFAGPMRTSLLAAAKAVGLRVHERGCMAVTQGPRLETAAEIARLARDGCTVVGMTGMPEAGLAREAGLDFASLCVVSNPAAGLEDEPISLAEIERVLAAAMADVRRLLCALEQAGRQ